MRSFVAAVVLAPLVGCQTTIAFGAHATRPLSPADGAGDWEVAGGPADVPPRVPGPELVQPEPSIRPVIYRTNAPVPGGPPVPRSATMTPTLTPTAPTTVP